VPFGELQRQVVLTVRRRFGGDLPRLMLRIAERIARDCRAKPRHGRSDRPGCLADPREPHRDRRRRRMPILRPLVAWTRKRLSPRPSVSDLRDLDHSRPGLLPVVHAASPETHARHCSRGGGVEAADREMVKAAVDGTVTESSVPAYFRVSTSEPETGPRHVVPL